LSESRHVGQPSIRGSPDRSDVAIKPEYKGRHHSP
jgi:hypothetical protein